MPIGRWQHGGRSQVEGATAVQDERARAGSHRARSHVLVMFPT